MMDINVIKGDDRPLLDHVRDRLNVASDTARRLVVQDLLLLDGKYFALTWAHFKDRDSEFRIWSGRVVDKGEWFHLKLFPETHGEAPTDCPPWLIDLAPPTDDPAANVWRSQCRARAAQKAGGLEYGSIIVFKEPLEFSDGHRSKAFRYMPGRCKLNGCVFKSLKNKRFYPIPHFTDRPHTVKAAS